MKFVRYHNEGQDRTGFLKPGYVIDLALALQWAGIADWTMGHILAIPVEQLALDRELLQAVREAYENAEGAGDGFLPASEVVFLPPVCHPGEVICVGLNYPPMADGSPFVPPEFPILFHKTASSLTGHGQPIILPEISRQVEYEGELAIVIGRTAKQIARADASSYIAGYTIANDIGARDVQARSSQWTSGKMFDTFCPLGPALVTTDEVPQPEDLRIETHLNDEMVQDGSTSQMIFDVWTLVSYISTLTTLRPGDVILTGSPKTAGQKPDPRKLLQPGDVITIEIEGVGVLSNPVVKES